MNIAYDAAHRIFKLDTDHTSYVMASAPIPPAAR